MNHICAYSSFLSADSAEMARDQMLHIPPPVQAQLYGEHTVEDFPCRAQVLPLHFFNYYFFLHQGDIYLQWGCVCTSVFMMVRDGNCGYGHLGNAQLPPVHWQRQLVASHWVQLSPHAGSECTNALHVHSNTRVCECTSL